MLKWLLPGARCLKNRIVCPSILVLISVAVSGVLIPVVFLGILSPTPEFSLAPASVAAAKPAQIMATTKLTVPDLRDLDHFGHSVAISRDIIVVGAPDDDNQEGIDAGAAYVFERTDGTWSLVTRLVGSDTEQGDQFGYSVDVWGFSFGGARIIVGAPFNDNSAGIDAGAAYVFKRSGPGWIQERRVNIGHLRGVNDRFGSAVGTWRFDAVVGVPLDDTPNPGGLSGSGSATVFTRLQDWGVRGLLTAGANSGNFFRFGSDVAIWQTTAVVAEPGDVYVFVAPLGGESPYVFQARLQVPFGGKAAFGRSVAVHSDSVVVGDPELSNFFGRGAVHVFVRSGTTWSHQERIFSPSNVVSFGSSVAIEGNVAVIGAPLSESVFGQLQQGAAFVHTRSGQAWSGATSIVANDGQDTDQFGFSVDVSQGTAVIGAPFNNEPVTVGTGTDPGSVYVVAVP